MEAVKSYSHQLLDQTAFTQIEKEDSYLTCSWKIPAGRIASATVTLAALAETVLFTVLTVFTSPLYLIDNDRFSAIAGDALDAAKTVGLSTGRFFGIGTIEKEEIPEALPTPPAKPTSRLQKIFQSLKGRITNIPQIALKHPNITFAAFTAVALGAAIVGAHHFGLLEKAYSLLPGTSPGNPPLPTPPSPPLLDNICLPSDAPKRISDTAYIASKTVGDLWTKGHPNMIVSAEIGKLIS